MIWIEVDGKLYAEKWSNSYAKREIISEKSPFHSREGTPASSGIVLNIAAGIARAFIQKGLVLLSFKDLGETYGQWGRYLFRQNNPANIWIWKPTSNGSIPTYNKDKETRFTDYCGGPALARRFLLCCTEANSLPQELIDAMEAMPPAGNTDVTLEKRLLMQITKSAYLNTKSRVAAQFVEEVGCDIGSAMQCVFDAVGPGIFGNKLLLTGGVGEKFGKPHENTSEDLFIAGIKTVLEKPISDIVIQRSTSGIDDELKGSLL